MRDFKCSYSNSAGVRENVTEGLGLTFPEAYTKKDSLKILAKAIKDGDNAKYCILPLCRTLEAEAMGANIKLGDEKAGPRAAEPTCSSLEEVLELPEIDFSKGRIKETLDALAELKEEGEVTSIEIVGPTTILTSLADPKVVYKAYRKNPELAKAAMNKIGDQLLRYIEEAKKAKVDVIIFSDSAGALDILGPRIMETTVEIFLADFIRKAADLIDDSCILLVCPKFAYALMDTDNAEIKEHQLEEGIDFLDALVEMKGRAKVAGQLCIKHTGVKLATGKFWELVIK